jgi:hypothetical protein
MAIFDSEHQPPEASPGDLIHKAADSLASAVPGGSQLVHAVFTPPLERRRDDRMRDVGAKLREPSERNHVDFALLADNDAFVDTVFTASHAAIRTNQQRKRAALRNAILNAALPGAPSLAKH